MASSVLRLLTVHYGLHTGTKGNSYATDSLFLALSNIFSMKTNVQTYKYIYFQHHGSVCCLYEMHVGCIVSGAASSRISCCDLQPPVTACSDGTMDCAWCKSRRWFLPMQSIASGAHYISNAWVQNRNRESQWAGSVTLRKTISILLKTPSVLTGNKAVYWFIGWSEVPFACAYVRCCSLALSPSFSLCLQPPCVCQKTSGDLHVRSVCPADSLNTDHIDPAQGPWVLLGKKKVSTSFGLCTWIFLSISGFHSHWLLISRLLRSNNTAVARAFILCFFRLSLSVSNTTCLIAMWESDCSDNDSPLLSDTVDVIRTAVHSSALEGINELISVALYIGLCWLDTGLLWSHSGDLLTRKLQQLPWSLVLCKCCLRDSFMCSHNRILFIKGEL